MIKKEAFEKVNGFKEMLAVGEDGDMVHRLSKVGRTRTDRHLYILYPGRREHQVGWPRLLSQWLLDWFSVRFFGHSKKDEWTAVR